MTVFCHIQENQITKCYVTTDQMVRLLKEGETGTKLVVQLYKNKKIMTDTL